MPRAAIHPQRFRQLFRRHPGGVVVVTADAGTGPVGFTATSFTGVSLEPPLAAFAVARHASAWPQLHAASSVVVHLLGPDDGPLAQRFATSGIDRFAAPTRWSRLPTGEPVLAHGGAWLRGEILDRIPVGDHHLVVVHIDAADIGSLRAALVYHDGAYHAVGARD
jgi:flavin reductase (DIM6/NTAB) family NADH-FMN oxidoreductase RutF